MQIVRFLLEGRLPRFGWIHEDKIGAIEGSIFAPFQRGEADIRFEEVTLLPPVEPSKIICVGRNYAAHAAEHKAEVPDLPILFLKPPTTILRPGGTILLPPQSKQVEHEAELAVVIGSAGRWIQTENALDHVLGYTVANDVTARDLQRRDLQWTRGKGFDTFCPIGPWVETEFSPVDSMITCHVNDELRQMGSTRDMIFSVRQLISYISSVMTLLPGDLLLTGTPAGVGILQPGDEVTVAVDGLGVLRNRVAAEKPR
jgi:2-keto-4-pentenoate hydratase/2-oxohepta-3-ene-1,7-dioic acid hydratase in catechol pathway